MIIRDVNKAVYNSTEEVGGCGPDREIGNGICDK